MRVRTAVYVSVLLWRRTSFGTDGLNGELGGFLSGAVDEGAVIPEASGDGAAFDGYGGRPGCATS